MVHRRAPHRTFSAVVVAAALTVIGIGLPTDAADASTRSPWDAIAQCESGGNWSINTGNGYYGGLQFSAATWAAHGGRGSAASASRAEQIKIGRRVVATQGWEAWSGCSARLGLHGRSAAPRDGGSSASKKMATCRPKALRARYAEGVSTVGTRYAYLQLTNTGQHRCRLAGASRSIHLTADRFGAAAFTPVRRGEVTSKQPHLVLKAHGGRAWSRIMIEPSAGHRTKCRPAHITILPGASDTSDGPLDGLRLQTCADTKHKVLSLGHPRTNRSATQR